MRRTKKTVAGVVTYFVWAGNRLVAEHDNSAVRQVRYVVGPSYAPLQVGFGPGLTEPRGDVHVDHLATPRTMSNGAATWTWGGEFEGFGGHQVDPASTAELNLRLPGQYFDIESASHYNLLRFYSPPIGRYLSPDPIGQIGGVNLHSYARQNPLTFIDPDGDMPISYPTSPFTGPADSVGGIVYDKSDGTVTYFDSDGSPTGQDYAHDGIRSGTKRTDDGPYELADDESMSVDPSQSQGAFCDDRGKCWYRAFSPLGGDRPNCKENYPGRCGFHPDGNAYGSRGCPVFGTGGAKEPGNAGDTSPTRSRIESYPKGTRVEVRP